MDTDGADFNDEFHEAVALVPGDEANKGNEASAEDVAEVFEYIFHRHAAGSVESAATSAGESLRAHGVAELVVARALVGVRPWPSCPAMKPTKARSSAPCRKDT